MNLNHTNCEVIEPLISAMIDGELVGQEQVQVEQHLEHCQACQLKANSFEQVDAAALLLSARRVDTLGTLDAVDDVVTSKTTNVYVVSRDKSSLKSWLSLGRLAVMAAAATIVVGFAISMFPNQQPATASQFSADEIVQPIQELQLIHRQQQRDQELMLKTLEMDLRALRLELNELDPESDERKNLASDIDAMIEKVKQFKD